MVENVRRITKAVRNTSRVLHQLLQIIEDSNIEGLFNRVVIERR